MNYWVHADNPASIRPHQKLGFTQEGVRRRMLFSDGQYVDELWFGMTVDEFHQFHPAAQKERVR